VFIRLSNINL